MESNFASSPLIEQHDQNCYVDFKKIHIFLYTNKGADTTFLLRKKPSSNKFVEFKGKLNTLDDPTIVFSGARKLFKKTAGLLSESNIKFFLENSMEIESPQLDMSQVELADYQVQQPKRMKHAFYQEFLGKLTTTNYQYQIPKSNTAIYFIEIPAINIPKLNDFCREKQLPFEFLQATYESIINDEDDRISSSLRPFISQFGLKEFIQEYIIKQKPVIFTKSYGMFVCQPKIKNNKYQALYYSCFKKFGEKWTFYHIPEYELPTAEELAEFNAVVIPGSGCAAYADDEWKETYFELLRNIRNNYPSCLLLGICYGAQSIAHCFGGRCEKMPNDYIRGSEPLNIGKEFFELPFVSGLDIKKTGELTISESHGDHIAKLPEDATLHASSRRTHVEIYTIGDRILGFQGHPEYNEQWTAGIVYQMNKETSDFVEYSEKVKEKFYPESLDQDDLMRIAHNFVKRTILV